ncbi:MAG: ATP-binding protein, partial [Hylemonella sp.]|nr:ATP-binding protein [Hylemonella sp.]
MRDPLLMSEQNRLLYAGLPSALFFNSLLALILGYTLSSVVAQGQILWWLALMGVMVSVRMVLYVRWRQIAGTEASSQLLWLNLFRITAILTGLVWGSASVLMFPADDAVHQVLMAFVIAGVSAGAITSQAIDRVTVLGFLVAILLPLSIRLIVDSGEIAGPMGWMGGLYLLFIAGNAVRAGKVLHENFELRRYADQREMQLRSSEERLNEAQQVAGLGSFDWNTVTGELSWSDEHFRLWGIKPQLVEPSYELFHQGIHPDDVAQTEEAITRALDGGQFYETLFRVVGRDGQVRFIRGKGEAIFDDQGKGVRVIGTVQDVSDRVRIEQDLREAKQAAEIASRAKSEFLASMSHELRTPLNAILGFSQLLAMDDALNEDTRGQVREIEQAGKHLLTLVSDLVDLARIEAGKLELNREQVPVEAVVDNSVGLVAPIASAHGIVIKQRVAKTHGDLLVTADYNRLRQVLINLLSNAIKYNRKGGSVTVSSRVDGDRLRLSVSDTGVGIPQAVQQRIFNAFDRLGAERSLVEGTGIGLVISRRLVEAMGGSIGFESVEGHGSTFWLELPLEDEPTTQLPVSGMAALETNARTSEQPVVLYIEDSPLNVRLMRQIFVHRKDVQLRDAHTADLGIELARAEPPLLILVEIALPRKDGFAALKELKSDPRTASIPVVAVSSNALSHDDERCREAGFAGYLGQPIDIRALHALLDRFLPGAGQGGLRQFVADDTKR